VRVTILIWLTMGLAAYPAPAKAQAVAAAGPQLTANPGGGGTIGGEHRTRVADARQRGGIQTPSGGGAP